MTQVSALCYEVHLLFIFYKDSLYEVVHMVYFVLVILIGYKRQGRRRFVNTFGHENFVIMRLGYDRFFRSSVRTFQCKEIHERVPPL